MRGLRSYVESAPPQRFLCPCHDARVRGSLLSLSLRPFGDCSTTLSFFRVPLTVTVNETREKEKVPGVFHDLLSPCDRGFSQCGFLPTQVSLNQVLLILLTKWEDL